MTKCIDRRSYDQLLKDAMAATAPLNLSLPNLHKIFGLDPKANGSRTVEQVLWKLAEVVNLDIAERCRNIIAMRRTLKRARPNNHARQRGLLRKRWARIGPETLRHYIVHGSIAQQGQACRVLKQVCG